jgi:hypothetical protein
MYSPIFRYKHQTASEELMVTDVIVPNETPQQKQSNASWLSCAWQYLMHHLLNGHEPRVWQKRNTAGEVFYRAYDPYTGRSAYLTSDIDLRIWLEQLPYQ